LRIADFGLGIELTQIEIRYSSKRFLQNGKNQLAARETHL
jgi:hypothetical protein